MPDKKPPTTNDMMDFILSPDVAMRRVKADFKKFVAFVGEKPDATTSGAANCRNKFVKTAMNMSKTQLAERMFALACVSMDNDERALLHKRALDNEKLRNEDFCRITKEDHDQTVQEAVDFFNYLRRYIDRLRVNLKKCANDTVKIDADLMDIKRSLAKMLVGGLTDEEADSRNRSITERVTRYLNTIDEKFTDKEVDSGTLNIQQSMIEVDVIEKPLPSWMKAEN